MNQWFAAHLILYVEFKKHRQKSYPIWENVVLIHAESEEEAFAKARKRGQEQEGDSGDDFTWDGKPAKWVFAGVRKLTTCEDAEDRPGDGTEITFTEMRVRSREAIGKLLDGVPVGVQYTEQFRD
jgi:hypothetical protein